MSITQKSVLNRVTSLLLGITLIFLFSPRISFSQATTGSVSGIITNEQGEPVEAATLTAQKMGTVNFFTAITDAKGRYVFPNLSPGIFTMNVNSEGYHRLTQEVTVKLGGKISLHFKLTKVMEIREEVVVTADAPVVETTKAAIDQNISFEQFKDIPTQGRDFNSIISTFAGVSRYNNSFNVWGSRDTQNNFLIDGMKNNMLGDDQPLAQGSYARALYGYFPSTKQAAAEHVQTVPGGTLQDLNLDAIEEVQMSKAGYSAEYGQGSGAVFNIVTRSGSDKIKFGFTINHQTHTVNDAFVSEKDKSPYPMKRWQESVFLGGPIIKGKLRFFVSYDRDDYYVGFDDRTLTESMGNFWVRDLDIWQSERRVNRFTGKLTFIETDKSKYNLTLTYSGDAGQFNMTTYKAPNDIDNRKGTNRGFTVLLNNQRQFESGLLNLSVKYTHVDRYTKREPIGDNLELRVNMYDDEYGYWIRRFGAYGNDLDTSANSFQVKATYNWFLKDKAGDHNLLLGFDYENYKQHTVLQPFNYVAFQNTTGPGAEYLHPSDTSFYLWFVQTSGGNDYKLPLSQASVFANEEWSITPNLTLTAGFRVDWDEFIDKVFFSPRIGLAWDPFGDGKTVVRGGIGVFRDRSEVAGYATTTRNNTTQINFKNAGPFAADPQDLATWEKFKDPQYYASSTVFDSYYGIDSDLQPPMTWEANIGFERDLFKGIVFRANYIYKNMDKLFYMKTSNNYTDFVNGMWVRPDPTKGRIYTLMNAGLMTAHDVELMLSKSFKGGSFINLSYVWEDTNGNSASSLGEGWFENFNQSGESTNWVDYKAPADFEIKHYFKGSWSFVLPLDFIFSGFFQFRTGRPFNVYQQEYVPSWTVGWRLAEPRNSRTLPFFRTLDVRLSKRVRIGNHSFQVFADVFNLLNRSNVLQVNGSVTRGNFLEPLSFDKPRQVQLGLRWEFN